MAKSILSQKESQITLILDTDVITNWLVKETETTTKRELWKAPHKIISLIEDKKLKGLTSLTTLLEIRFLLRRKKEYNELQIENFVNDITSLFEIVIPDEISLLEANKLQSENLLDPFDAISLGICVTQKPSAFISRDSDFLEIASKSIHAFTPEQFVDRFL